MTGGEGGGGAEGFDARRRGGRGRWRGGGGDRGGDGRGVRGKLRSSLAKIRHQESGGLIGKI